MNTLLQSQYFGRKSAESIRQTIDSNYVQEVLKVLELRRKGALNDNEAAFLLVQSERYYRSYWATNNAFLDGQQYIKYQKTYPHFEDRIYMNKVNMNKELQSLKLDAASIRKGGTKDQIAAVDEEARSIVISAFARHARSGIRASLHEEDNGSAKLLNHLKEFEYGWDTKAFGRLRPLASSFKTARL